MQILVAALAGLIFGCGLLLSGMANPAKVLGFLNLRGDWDPSLALVMAGALVVAFPAFTWAKRRSKSLLGAPMQLPVASQLDRSLLLGSALFGLGWGLAGFCPGPALVAIGLVPSKALIFVAAMLAGMALHAVITRQLARPSKTPPAP